MLSTEYVIFQNKLEDKVFKPLEDLYLPEKTIVSIAFRESFSDLPEELGEPEAQEDIDTVLKEMHTWYLRFIIVAFCEEEAWLKKTL